MKNAILTGANGFIGNALAEKMLDRGYKVYGLGIGGNGDAAHAENYVSINADYREFHDLDKALPANADAFFHLASVGQLKGSDLNNVDIQIENVVCACEAAKLALKLRCKKYVLISSSYQYMYGIGTKDYACAYGRAKAAAEEFCGLLLRNSGIEYNIAVLTNTFGPGDRSEKAVNTFLKALLANRELNLVRGERPNDWVYIDDTVNGILSVLDKGIAGKKYYIGHKDISNFKDKLLEMKEILHSGSRLKFGTYPEDTFVDYTNLNADELYRDTGFRCACGFRESILKTAEWVKSLNR